MKMINEMNNKWKVVEINIAVTGESGSGKYSFINALRNMKAGDVGAAHIGCRETTMEPTPYSFKNSENVRLWDLPGVGKPNFSRETYLQKVKIERYDFIILVTSTRFKQDDARLANEITRLFPKSNLCFIRTKVDNDINNCQMGTRTSVEPEKTVANIRDSISHYLADAGIRNSNIFLINSYRVDTLDFRDLSRTLIKKASELKREAMVLSLFCVADDILAEKINVLKKRMRDIAVSGAMSAVKKDHSSLLKVLMKEGLFYKLQLGKDTQSIVVLATMLEKQEDQIYQELEMQSHKILKTEATFASFYDYFDNFRPSFYHHIPYFGKLLQVREYQYQCIAVLKVLLDMCSSETKRLSSNLEKLFKK